VEARTEASPGRSPAATIRFGPFELDLRAAELRKHSLRIRLQDQPFQILRMLLECPGDVVLREEIRNQLWPNDTVVEFEHSINTAVKRLRDALGESADKPRYVETLAKRGYRFIGQVEALKAIDTLAVLPFANVGNDANTEYLSDGITDGITNNLSQLAGLRVTARSMVFAYKGKTVNPQQAGKDLKVRAVLTGSVTERGGVLIIRAELMDVANASQLWGEQYRRKMADIMAIEAEISQEISQRLRPKLTGEDRARLARRATENTEAYQLYLKGRHYWNQRTIEGLRKAIDSFQQAIDKDRAYARAYAGLADAYNSIGFRGAAPAKEVFPNARAAATRALALDDTLSEAHISLASVRYLYDWDWPAAESEFKRAIELDPDYAVGHDFYGHFLQMMNRTAESTREFQRAQALDPVSLPINARSGIQLYFTHQFDRAIEQLGKTLELDANFPSTRESLAMCYLAKSMSSDAIELVKDLPGPPVLLAIAYAQAGRTGDAEKLLRQMEEMAKIMYISPVDFAYVYAALGQKDTAIQWLEKGYEARAAQMIFLGWDPKVDSLRSDASFKDLLRRVGLPQ
jgi:TolB-like protein/Tfp pilus assembly protein PilF